jgi:hypothetical protein
MFLSGVKITLEPIRAIVKAQRTYMKEGASAVNRHFLMGRSHRVFSMGCHYQSIATGFFGWGVMDSWLPPVNSHRVFVDEVSWLPPLSVESQ